METELTEVQILEKTVAHYDNRLKRVAAAMAQLTAEWDYCIGEQTIAVDSLSALQGV